MVVGDQAALVVDAELPVEPDPGGQGEQPLGDPDPQPLRGVGAMAFQPELVFAGVEGALDPLAEATQRPEPVRLVTAVGRTSTAPSSPICWAKARPARPLSAAMTIPWPSSPWSLASPSSSAATRAPPAWGGKSPGHRHAVRSGQQVQL